MTRIVHVAAAVIRRQDGLVLIARRPAHLHQGGLWEFPGGKVEPGETVYDALRRELAEELGIDVVESPYNVPLIQVHHDYGDKQVFLDVWRVDAFEGEPHGREGQSVAWVAPEDLCSYPFPAANQPIVQAARLPDRYLITGGFASFNDFESRLESALERGVRLVQLRAKDLSAADLDELSERALACCRRYGAKLMLNASVDAVLRVGADGVHLSADRLRALYERPLPKQLWVAASCHNEQEVSQAQRLRVDFVVLSPVKETGSHPGASVIGWQRFETMVRSATLPVFALGGLGDADLADARRHGAQGVAAISAWW